MTTREASLDHGGNRIVFDAVKGGGPCVVFIGGYASARKSVKGSALLDWALREERSFVRFDYSGHGDSGGRFEDATLGLWLEETLRVIDEAAQPGPVILVGSSMGGWIALLAAAARPARVHGLITIACGADFTEEVLRPRLPPFAIEELASKGVVYRPEANGNPPTALTARFMEEAKAHLLLNRKIPIACPCRLFHGMKDMDVPWSISARVAERLESDDALLTIVKEGDHRLSTEKDLKRLYNAIEELSALAVSRGGA